MFKFGIVLCVALFASGADASSSSLLEEKETTGAMHGNLSAVVLEDGKTNRSSAAIQIEAQPRPKKPKESKPIELDTKSLEAEYNYSKDEWFSVTEKALKVMEIYSTMAERNNVSMNQIYNSVLNDVKLYVRLTRRCSTRALNIISQSPAAYSLERYDKLNSHVREVQRNVDNLIHQTGNVSAFACKTYSDELTTTMTFRGKGMTLLWLANKCSRRALQKAIRVANSTNQIVVREYERLAEIREQNSNCYFDGCDVLMKRQVAKCGSILIQSVKGGMRMVDSIVLNLSETQEMCNRTSGLVDYHTNLTMILEDTRRCIEQRTMKNATAIVPSGSVMSEGEQNGSISDITKTVPKDHTWKAPVESHKDAAEELINKTMKKYVRWIDGRREANNPLLADVMQQSNEFNASMQNSIDILIQTIKSSAENRTSELYHVDVSECERYSDFFEAAKTARINGASCIDGILSLVIKTIDIIEAITFEELERIDAIRKRVQQCGDKIHNVSSAVEAMRCYHDHQIQVSRGIKQTKRWLTGKIATLESLFANFGDDLLKCRNESSFNFLFAETEKIANKIDECIQRKINGFSVWTNEADTGTKVPPRG